MAAADNDDDLLYGDLGSVASSSQVVVDKEEAMPVPAVPAMPILHVYPLASYSFGVKEAGWEWETSFSVRMANLERFYSQNEMRRSVEAVLLTYEHNHPHVLLLQLGDSNVYRL